METINQEPAGPGNNGPLKSSMISWQLMLKIVFIGIVFFVLLIPKLMIIGLMEERKTTAESARAEVMEKWSRDQVVRGPVLTVPVTETVTGQEDKNPTVVQSQRYFLPQELNIDGQLMPRDRFRSIYKVVVYESEIRISGTFAPPSPEILQASGETEWNKAELSIGLSDLRGISNMVEMVWNGQKYTFLPGMDDPVIGTGGISLPLPLDPATSFPATFECILHLKGSHSLHFSPLGETTTVKLASAWNDPGFTGSFLPVSHNITPDGFTADWKVLHFNRNFPQNWKGDKYKMAGSDFGVELVTVADHYQKNIRSAKYGILVIVLVFISFFLSEVISGERIHPVQYALVGFALLLFYLLLLSLSEHLGFNISYLIASAAVLTMVFAYSRSFLKKRINSLMLTAVLAASFIFIFVLLQMETYALVTGSIVLFIILGLIMYLTRKINWYNE
ncbi:MAG: cell envelope integrity protein CreD [Bacteroidales bacterium]|nr:cell envelope integrity protein CreD [Bacteroidales bacterium]